MEPTPSEPSLEEDEELVRLTEAFHRGDYHAVNEGARALLTRSKSSVVAERASALRERTRVAPIFKVILFGSLALLVFLTVWFQLHR